MIVNELVTATNIARGTSPLSACPAADENANGAVVILELIRGRIAAIQGNCSNLFPPAGVRGEVKDGAAGTRLPSANVDVWLWPPPESTGPGWVWPEGNSIPPTSTATTFNHLAMSTAGQPNYGFDPIAGACIAGVPRVGFPAGLHRMRARKSGYQSTVSYRFFDFSSQATTYSTAACTEISSSPHDTENFSLFANGVGHEALPDIVVDPRELNQGFPVFCIDMPNQSNDPAYAAASQIIPQLRDLAELRAGVRTANVGYGRLMLDGTSAPVVQRIFNRDGSLSRVVPLPSSSFEEDRDHGHNHIHFANWAKMLLIRNDSANCSNRATRQPGYCEIAQSRKLSFCIEDTDPFDDEIRAGRPKISGCQTRVQGISPGWADLYGRRTRGQFVEVTTVPDGSYWVEAVFDSEAQFRDSAGVRTEANPENNWARSPVFSYSSRCETQQQGAVFRCRSGLPETVCESFDCRAILPNCCVPGLTTGQITQCARCQEAYCHLNSSVTNPACRDVGNHECCSLPTACE